MVTRLLKVVGVSALVAMSPMAATAAIIEAEQLPSGAGSIILVEGELQYGDERRFIDIALKAGNAIVALSGPGGNLVAGIEIGKTIRLKGFPTFVAEDFHCASACALAWLGGSPRYMADGATIGFHAAYSDASGQSIPDSAANAIVGAYLNQLGLTLSAVIYMTETHPSGMRWLTFAEAEKIGLEVRRLPSDGNDQEIGERADRTTPSDQPLDDVARRNWGDAGEWIQMFSRARYSDAMTLASEYRSRFGNTSVFRFDNGWYVVVIGPYPVGEGRAVRDRLVAIDAIPDDSLVSRGSRYVELVSGTPSTASPNPPMRTTATTRALETAQSFFRYTSLPDRLALNRLDEIYADEVMYYGKPTAKADVLKDKATFFKRWPERDYRIRTPATNATCRADRNCTVDGLADWNVYSPERNTTSVGTVRFILVISVRDAARILSETSEVMSRRIYEGR